ncbi:MAG: hypothetical protein ACQEQL_06050 [Pseudomonadota bacterium]
MKIKNILPALALTTLLMGGAAHADVFVYNDPDFGYSVMYPDTWRMNVPDSGTERFRIAPMHGQDQVECAMSAVKDGRLNLYPQKLMDKAVPATLDQSFWAEDVLPDYPNYHVLKFHAPAGLGQGYASSVQITWDNLLVDTPMAVTDVVAEEDALPAPVGTQQAVSADNVTDDAADTMRASMVATIYGGNRYRFTCQANGAAFEDWEPVFGSILDSVRFDQEHAMVPTGYYRNFLADGPLFQ